MVYIVLLNWNGWEDTISCLESIFKLSFQQFRVIVCDNASTDGSMDKIKAWLNGTLDASVPEGQLAKLVKPFCHKPLNWTEYDRDNAELGGEQSECAKVVLIQTGANLGFAGGNNVGLRYIKARQDAKYIWLLNNDTLVENYALSALVNRIDANPSIGIVGSSLCYYSSPETLQACGGARYYPWRIKARPIGENAKFRLFSAKELLEIENHLGYIIGASMFIRADFLETIGLMQEDYFLYYEELDWAERAKGLYKLGYAADSRVYHKVGASAGTTSRSFFSLKYLYVNQLRFTLRFYPKRMLLSRITIFEDGIREMIKRNFKEGLFIIKLAFSKAKL